MKNEPSYSPSEVQENLVLSTAISIQKYIVCTSTANGSGINSLVHVQLTVQKYIVWYKYIEQYRINVLYKYN